MVRRLNTNHRHAPVSLFGNKFIIHVLEVYELEVKLWQQSDHLKPLGLKKKWQAK
ncbi:hypothetical protein Desmer_0890 [Desulfosporosinus meridiei DSM 13257]|uniref:Uncharacterized protein n=1 Tax=Desulfosporosinus meridiei (strain ATCC BAA-275 / DSM 13257 / KCTC 12902 / NCIMB 13706 / S10) TaxID=768704 RepID=J7IRV4_DESMD|nr:hypothetical protein Desmer_0890 [Desulfosporosinus meridiei DSM 13257]